MKRWMTNVLCVTALAGCSTSGGGTGADAGTRAEGGGGGGIPWTAFPSYCPTTSLSSVSSAKCTYDSRTATFAFAPSGLLLVFDEASCSLTKQSTSCAIDCCYAYYNCGGREVDVEWPHGDGTGGWEIVVSGGGGVFDVTTGGSSSSSSGGSSSGGTGCAGKCSNCLRA